MLLFSKKLEKLQFLSFVLFFIVPCRVVLFRKTYWKQAKYGPCTQKGNCQHPSNYRLISLTSCIVSALFEKIISSQPHDEAFRTCYMIYNTASANTGHVKPDWSL